MRKCVKQANYFEGCDHLMIWSLSLLVKKLRCICTHGKKSDLEEGATRTKLTGGKSVLDMCLP